MSSLGLTRNQHTAFASEPGDSGNRPEDRTDPYLGCSFLVEVEGILAGGFSECGGLEVETEIEPYREGGQNDYVHHFAGPTKYPPLILKHGLTTIDGLWTWHQDVVAGQIARHNGTIHLLDRNRTTIMSWDFKEAFPVKWTGPTLQADRAQVAIESLELRHRGLSRAQNGSAAGGGL
jgi:phage tail-like protein